MSLCLVRRPPPTPIVFISIFSQRLPWPTMSICQYQWIHIKERVPCTPVLQDSHLTSYICSLSWIIPVHIEILPFRKERYSHSNDGESTEKRLLLIKRIFSHLSINVTRGRCIHIYWRPSVSQYLAHPRPRLLTSSWCWQTTSGSTTCPGTTRYISRI